MEWKTELYPAQEKAALAQELFDSGLLTLANAVLHPHGLALGAIVEDGIVGGLSLHESSDPQGIWFDEETTVVGRRKLIAAGLLRVRRVIAR